MFWIKPKKAGKLRHLGRQILAIAVVITAAWQIGSQPALATSESLSLGIQALQHREFAAAVEYLTQAANEGGDLGEIYGHRCVAQLMLNAPQRAVHDCSLSAQAASSHPKAHFYRGLAHYRLEHFAAAIADFSQHLQATAEDARTYYNRGLAYFAQRNVEAAIADYHRALTFAEGLQPIEMSNLYNDLGVAYLSASKFTEARLALDQAVALGKDDLRAYFNRGCVCHHQGHYAAALDDFDYVIAHDPDHADSYLSRGLSRQRLGDRSGAESDFRAAIQQFHAQRNSVGLQQAKWQLIQLHAQPQAVG